jgi:hypothetical protein
MKTYRITSLVGGFGPLCAPPIVYALWPTFDGWPCTLSEHELTVSVPDSAPAPADLGPLVKVELVSE